jgi:hypothetical protein
LLLRGLTRLLRWGGERAEYMYILKVKVRRHIYPGNENNRRRIIEFAQSLVDDLTLDFI